MDHRSAVKYHTPQSATNASAASPTRIAIKWMPLIIGCLVLASDRRFCLAAGDYDSVAPKAVISRARSHIAAGFPVGPPPVIPAPTNSAAAARAVMTTANTKWAYEELTHLDRNADADYWQAVAKIDPIRYATGHKEGF